MSGIRERIRILIADDHAIVREGLVSLVKRKSDMVVVAEASNGREAVDLWKQHRPDVTLLDLRMPELDGVALHLGHVLGAPGRSKKFARSIQTRTSWS